jgi:hypothetical protein
LPHLPFRAIKKIQPALFQVYFELGGAAMSSASVAQLGEAQLDRLAEATYLAITHVDPDLSRESFLDLPFSVGELMQAFPAVASSAGLRSASPAAASQREAAQEAPGESISIG